jgi:hypothetical protein
MHMAAKISKISTFILISLLLALIPLTAAADPTQISQGNTIFIGEQGLDISLAIGNDTRIGWWASAASISGSAPSQTMTITNPTSFSVTSAAFSGYTGNWYRLNGAGQENGFAFSVHDPQLSVRVIDDTLSLDRTNDWLPTGDFARFAIDSNLDVVSNQRGLGAPVTIRVVAPDGGEYSSLYGPGGSGPNPVTNLLITSNPYLTLFTWDTGNPAYYQGTYTIWAECTLNGMKDNYPVSGKSISNKITLLNQDVNPLIRSTVLTTTPTTTIPTATATSKPVISVVTTIPKTQVTIPEISNPVTPTSVPTSAETILPTNAPSTTRAPGFEFITALFAMIISLGVCLKKE